VMDSRELFQRPMTAVTAPFRFKHRRTTSNSSFVLDWRTSRAVARNVGQDEQLNRYGLSFVRSPEAKGHLEPREHAMTKCGPAEQRRVYKVSVPCGQIGNPD
jgi:hypothetical protein